MSLTNGKPWVQQYSENTLQSTDITSWTTGTSLPEGLNNSSVLVTDSRVYLLGGFTTVAVATVYTAPINSDGTLGTWTTGTSLPGALYGSQAVITGSRVYLIGGHNGTVAVATVYTAPINSDGTLGTWATGTGLPGVLSLSQAIVTSSRVYLLGGLTTVAVATVYTAPINPDGTLGTWATGTGLPGALWFSSVIVTNSRVYLLGGVAAATTAIVYTASINLDGTLGAWTTGTSLPVALNNSQTVVTNGRAYLIGGQTSSTVATVYTAPITPDGTLGTWATGTSLPGVLRVSQAIVTNSKVYLLGGYAASSVVSTVYTASFLGGRNNYLFLLALSGSIIEVTGITNWRVTASLCSTGAAVATTTTGEGGSTYSIPAEEATPYNLTLSPKIDYVWSAAKSTTLGDYVVAVNPDANPHLWKCTTAGLTDATTEPSWATSGTTTDNTTTWTYVAPLVDPIAIGPKIPA